MQEAQRNKELESTGRGSVGVRAHTDRCLRCASLLGSEHHWDALLYPDGDGVTDAPWECGVEYKSQLQTPSNTYSFHLMDPSPALFTPSLKYFTQVIYKTICVCVCVTVQCVFIYWCMCPSVCVRAAACISMFTQFCLCMHLHISVYVRRCVCTCPSAGDCEQLCTHLFICLNMCVYMHACFTAIVYK